jgi:hypothetical protein
MHRRISIPGWIALILAIGITPVFVSLAYLRDDRLAGTPGQFQGDTFQVVPRATNTPLPAVPETGANPAVPTHLPPVEPTPVRQTCTYTRYYWLENPQNWLTENVIIGSYSFHQADILTSLGLEGDDLPNRLLQEFFAAVLNVAHGANPSQVSDTLNEAGGWLSTHMRQNSFSPVKSETALALAASLEQYNNGLYGPGACPGQDPTPTPSASASSLPLPGSTPLPTPTRRTFFPSAQSTATTAPQSLPTATTSFGFTPAPTITSQPFPTLTPPPGASLTPTSSLTPLPGSTATPIPGGTVSPTSTLRPTITPRPTSTDTPVPSSTPPEDTPEPTSTQVPTNPPDPTATFTPAPTATSASSPCNITTGTIQINPGAKYMWFHVTNLTSSTLRITSIYAIWPSDTNGVLKEINFGGNQIFISDSALSPASIPSSYPWKESALDSYRDIGPGVEKKLEFRYETSAARFGYFTQITFDNGCVITSP